MTKQKLFVKNLTVIALGGVGGDSVQGKSTNLTGSGFELTFNYSDGSSKKALVDFGLHQGSDDSSSLNRAILPKLDYEAIFVTHSHIDHCGRIPYLVANGYEGKIYFSSFNSLALSYIQLKDCANLLDKEYSSELALFKKKKNLCGEPTRIEKMREKSRSSRNGDRYNKPTIQELKDAKILKETILKNLGVKNIDDAAPLEPIYLINDVDQAFDQSEVLPEAIDELPCVSFDVYSTGHILGSNSILITFRTKGGRNKRVLFSGDVGSYNRYFSPHGDPQTNKKLLLNAIFCETTYGSKVREENYYIKGLLDFLSDVKANFERGKTIVIPAFAMDRSQEVVYQLNKYLGNRVPIYYDTKSGHKISAIYQEEIPEYENLNYEYLDSSTRGEFFKTEGRKIVVTTSGMCSGGPIEDYLKEYLQNPEAVIMLTGYMSPDTIGGKLLRGEKSIFIAGKEYLVNCRVYCYNFFSSHGDAASLLQFIEGWRTNENSRVFLNHGDVNSSTLDFKNLILEKQNKGETKIKGVPEIARLNQEIVI